MMKDKIIDWLVLKPEQLFGIVATVTMVCIILTIW